MSQESESVEPAGPLVVGYDGTDESVRALDLALEESALRFTPVVVVVVAAERYDWVDPYEPGMAIVPIAPIPEDGPLEVQPLLREARRRLDEAGADGDVEWGLGDPVSEIVRVADERHASAIVVGTHHHSALGRLFGADTAAAISREAHCDVIVAR
jgi:nucleotide-binding universal stress UspA family protein